MKKLILNLSASALLLQSLAPHSAIAEVKELPSTRTVAVVKSIVFDDARECEIFKELLSSVANSDLRFEIIDGDCTKYTPDEVIQKESLNWGNIMKNAGSLVFWAATLPIQAVVDFASQGDTGMGGPGMDSVHSTHTKVVRHDPVPGSNLLVGMIASLPNSQGTNFLITGLKPYDTALNENHSNSCKNNTDDWKGFISEKGCDIDTSFFEAVTSHLKNVILLLSNAVIQPSNIQIAFPEYYVANGQRVIATFDLDLSLAPILMQTNPIDQLTQH